MNPVDITRPFMGVPASLPTISNDGRNPVDSVPGVDPQAATAMVASSAGGPAGLAAARVGSVNYAAILNETLPTQPGMPDNVDGWADFYEFFTWGGCPNPEDINPLVSADLSQALMTVQGSKFHSEGPTVRDHYLLGFEFIQHLTRAGGLPEEMRSPQLNDLLGDLEVLRQSEVGKAYVDAMMMLATDPIDLSQLFFMHDLGKGERLQFRNNANPLALFELLSVVSTEVRGEIMLQGKPTSRSEDRPAAMTAEAYLQLLQAETDPKKREKMAKDLGAMNISNADALRLFNTYSPAMAQARAEKMGFTISNLGHDTATVEILEGWHKDNERIAGKEIQDFFRMYGSLNFEKVNYDAVAKLVGDAPASEIIPILYQLCLLQFVDHMSSRTEASNRAAALGVLPNFYQSIKGYEVICSVKKAYADAGIALEAKSDAIVANREELMQKLAVWTRVPESLNEGQISSLTSAVVGKAGNQDLANQIARQVASNTRRWREALRPFNSQLKKAARDVEAAVEGFLLDLGRQPQVIADPIFEGMVSARVTEIDKTKPFYFPVTVEVAFADGRTQSVPAATPVYTLTYAGVNTRLTISAASVAHILDTHFNPGKPASQFSYANIGELVADIAGRIDGARVNPTGRNEFRFSMGRNMGTDGVGSLNDLLASGAISTSDNEALGSYSDRLMAANLAGDAQALQALVASFKEEFSTSNIQLEYIARANCVVPRINMPPQPTQELMVVFGRSEDAQVATLYTASPGRSMPRFPSRQQHAIPGTSDINTTTFKESFDAWFRHSFLRG